MSIEVLAPEVVDQIAAGEVVERPSHLIKELVENSIDAGAKKVEIEFSLGGRSVRVSDDGHGIRKADLAKALLRFATSKIKTSSDIWSLKSFGFRGEALASISSVSRLRLISRTAEQDSAFQLISHFGVPEEVQAVSGGVGTTLWVDELFENVPARLKFMKSDVAEHTAIKTTLKAMALAHPEVEFRITDTHKLWAYWPAAKSRVERAEVILEVEGLFWGEAQRGNVKAFAVFADPHNVAKSTKNIWLFAQNRWIQDRGMQAAVLEAYRHTLMHGEYPIAAVWVSTDADAIDVNIHPTKSQVKFQESSLVFRAVAAAIRETLEKAPWLKGRSDLQSDPQGLAQSQNPYQQASDGSPFEFQPLSFESHDLQRTQFARKEFSMNSEHAQGQEPVVVARASFSNSDFRSVSGVPRVSIEDLAKAAETRKNLENPGAGEKIQGPWSQLEVLGQAHRTYIICQSGDRLVFVDQHAAHERVVFEKLMAAWKGGNIDIQEYLFPLAIELSLEKVEALIHLQEDIEKLGISIELLGPGTVGVRAAPLVVKESSLSKVLDQMATDCVEQGGSFRLERMIGDLCATMACHSVVRAGQTLSRDQMESLLSDMDQFPLSSFCPHGRPVSVEYPFYQLEKDFGRIV